MTTGVPPPPMCSCSSRLPIAAWSMTEARKRQCPRAMAGGVQTQDFLLRPEDTPRMTRPSLPGDDGRMRGFARRTTVAEAIRWLDAHTQRLPEEIVPLREAAGRVLAREVVSEVNVPGFVRAMMDGFAVRAADTSGASPYNRLSLTVVG